MPPGGAVPGKQRGGKGGRRRLPRRDDDGGGRRLPWRDDDGGKGGRRLPGETTTGREGEASFCGKALKSISIGSRGYGFGE